MARSRDKGNSAGSSDSLPSDVGRASGPSIFDIGSDAHRAWHGDLPNAAEQSSSGPQMDKNVEDKPATEQELQDAQEQLDSMQPGPDAYPVNNNEDPLPSKNSEQEQEPTQDQNSSQDQGPTQESNPDQDIDFSAPMPPMGQDVKDAPSAQANSQSGNTSESHSESSSHSESEGSSSHEEAQSQDHGQEQEQDHDHTM